MAKQYDQLDKLKQIIKFMEDHNIVKLKTNEFQVERGKRDSKANLDVKNRVISMNELDLPLEVRKSILKKIREKPKNTTDSGKQQK